MYHALLYYPPLDPQLSVQIDAIRRQHDPTVDVVRPHITVVFPIPDTVGESQLVAHIDDVLRERRPFEIRFGGLHKSPDHWLFLTLAEGEPEVKELYRSLYTGLLAPLRRDDIQFVPHLALGLFLNSDVQYDWDNPQESDFDREIYDAAVRQAEALPLAASYTVEELHLVEVPDAIIDWATGRRPGISPKLRIVDARVFRLVDHVA